MNKINNSVDALYPSWEPNSCNSAEFDAWWKGRFHSLPASSSATKVLFDGWDSWTIYAEAASKQFMVQMIKDINTQEIPAEVIAKNIALAKKHQEAQRAEPTGSELALLDDMEVEHLAIVPEYEVEAEHSVTVPKPEVTSVMSNNLIRLRTL
ncbi:hypothetical protein L3X38_023683 [Prunus dulcis]|uniref:Uncharacterized protein n=1 Tax=Prunus dulcis TaxID=3755 RepID=A0AAD4W0A1_PRUDU|nr:hypothetical protein L3X38_023683 [Prunus dulcis]